MLLQLSPENLSVPTVQFHHPRLLPGAWDASFFVWFPEIGENIDIFCKKGLLLQSMRAILFGQ